MSAFCRYCGENVPDGRVRRHHKRLHRITSLFPATFVGQPCKSNPPLFFEPKSCPSWCLCQFKSEGGAEKKKKEKMATKDEDYFADDEGSGDEKIADESESDKSDEEVGTVYGCLFCNGSFNGEKFFWSHLCTDHKFPASFISSNWLLFTRVGSREYLCIKCRLTLKKPKFYYHLKYVHKYSFRAIKKNLEKFELLELGNYYSTK